MAQRVPIDPDKGLTELVRQLGDDSRRLLTNEVRLAKIETSESMRQAGRGALWLGLAFGVAVVALVAFTLFFATFIGRVTNGAYWLGAMATAVIEIALGYWLLKKGTRALGDAPYSFPDTREALKVLKG